MTTYALGDRYAVDERRRRWLHAAAALTAEMDLTVGIEAALGLIAGRARTTADASAAAVVQFPPDSHPVISAGDGLPAAQITALVGQVIAQARSAHDFVVALVVLLDAGYADVVPLPARLTARGTLVVFHDQTPGDGGAEEREFLARFAEHAGLAVDRAEAVRERERFAVLTERDRIASDLHDVVIQRLFAVGLMLDAARTSGAGESLDRNLDAIVAELDQTIVAIRTTIFGLGSADRG